MTSTEKLVMVDFEVFGLVQGVCFRMYTQREAQSLGLRGWCKNTRKGSVKGVIEGVPDKVTEMKQWLQIKGSPSSRIERAVFGNEKDISKFSFQGFNIKS